MEYLFYLSTPLLLISGIPQTIKLVKTKKSRDVSIITYFLTWLGVFILLLNSINVKETPLILSNGVSLSMLTVNLFLIIRYK